MHIGRRVAKLREAHGESLRAAAVRTGVSHTTIARIEKGEVVGSFQSTLRKIAEGYGVQVEFLLGGRDPRGDFDRSLHRMSPEERSRLYFVPARVRIRMVLRFLLTTYPEEVSLDSLALQVGLPRANLSIMVNAEYPPPLPAETEYRIAGSLARMTGIPRHWFLTGSMTDDLETMSSEQINAFTNLIKKAATAGIEPEVLDMAIELLIIKNRDAKALPES